MIRIFVVGCPRSGTTLVHKLLAVHHDVYSCRETHYFQKIRRGEGKKGIADYLGLAPRRVLEAYSSMRSENELLGHYDPSRVRSLRSATLFFDQMMTSEAQARGKSAWVEKTPAHLFYIRLIRRHIPSVQFVHVIRDGRDVVASLVDAAKSFPQARAWNEYTDLEKAISSYNRYLAESLKHCDSEGQIFVRYEHILDDVKGVRRKLYALLGLESEDSSLDFGGVHRRLVRGDEGWKNDHAGRIKDTRLVKFNRIFDDQQKQLISGKVREPSVGVEKIQYI
jgi:hypothetical protein